MTDSQSWYVSKTLWGTALVAIAFVLNLLGYQLTPADQLAVADAGPDAILSIINAVGIVIAVWGRVTAKTKLTK